MIKVLLVTGSYPPLHCGVGDYTASLAQALRDTGEVRVAVLIGDRRGKAQPGIEMVYIKGWSLRGSLGALRAAAAWGPDVVHVQFPTQGYRSGWLPWFFPLLLRLAGLRVVQTWHEFMPMGSRLFALFLCLTPGPIIVVRPNYLRSVEGLYRWLLSRRELALIPNASSIPRSLLKPHERDELRARLAVGQRRIVTFFGFANPNKGVELLFEIADPERDRLVLLCELLESNPYHRRILEKSRTDPWKGKVTVSGYLPAMQVADVLSVSDAVVLPYPSGGGQWNASLHAAAAQGVFLVASSLTSEGYDPLRNIQYCRPGDADAMRAALRSRIGNRIEPGRDLGYDWAQIAQAHRRLLQRTVDHQEK